MEFKHVVMIVALACGAWALGVSTLIFLDDLSNIEIASEVPTASAITAPENFSSVKAIANTLNFYLPLGILCLAFLAYTRTTNPIGFEFLGLGVAVLGLATYAALKAGINLYDAGMTQLPDLIWWI
jgi:hypothetical protein